jgi:hypothetical protein
MQLNPAEASMPQYMFWYIARSPREMLGEIVVTGCISGGLGSPGFMKRPTWLPSLVRVRKPLVEKLKIRGGVEGEENLRADWVLKPPLMTREVRVRYWPEVEPAGSEEVSWRQNGDEARVGVEEEDEEEVVVEVEDVVVVVVVVVLVAEGVGVVVTLVLEVVVADEAGQFLS